MLAQAGAGVGGRHVVGENLDLVVLGRFKFDDGAAAKAQHLMHRHP